MPKCLVCGKGFKRHAPKQVTCSLNCSQERRRQHVRAYHKSHKVALVPVPDDVRKRKSYTRCPNEECGRSVEIDIGKLFIHCWHCGTRVDRPTNGKIRRQKSYA